MNAVAKPADAQGREVVPLTTGGQVAPIIPHSVEEMFRLANAMHASGLVPQTLDSKEKVLVAILAGAELGMPPNQAVQSFYVVNKRPTLWGDAIPALLWAHGFKLKEWFDKEESPSVAYCRITRPDGEIIERTYSVEDAKKAGLLGKTGPWQTNQKRMLQMRARAFAARDGAADALKGFRVREEEEDIPIRDVTPQKSGVAARLAASGSSGAPGFSQAKIEAVINGGEAHDPETGEIQDAEVEDLGLKTGAELLAAREAAAGPQTSQGPDTAEEAENAVQDADFEPADGFPGDRPATTSQAEQGAEGVDAPSDARAQGTRAATLSDRVNAVKAAMAKVADQQSLDAIWKRCAALRKELEDKDPEGLLVDLTDAHEAMVNALEANGG